MAEKEFPDFIAFINPRSGRKLGSKVYKELCNILDEENVFDVRDGGLYRGFVNMFNRIIYLKLNDEIVSLEKNKNRKNLKVLACGGDGTIGWVLSTIDKVNFKYGRPYVVPLPLGTGNDMSRVLQWGDYYGGENLYKWLLRVKTNGIPCVMDRWKLNIHRINDEEIEKTRREIEELYSTRKKNGLKHEEDGEEPEAESEESISSSEELKKSKDKKGKKKRDSSSESEDEESNTEEKIKEDSESKSTNNAKKKKSKREMSKNDDNNDKSEKSETSKSPKSKKKLSKSSNKVEEDEDTVNKVNNDKSEKSETLKSSKSKKKLSKSSDKVEEDEKTEDKVNNDETEKSETPKLRKSKKKSKKSSEKIEEDETENKVNNDKSEKSESPKSPKSKKKLIKSSDKVEEDEETEKQRESKKKSPKQKKNEDEKSSSEEEEGSQENDEIREHVFHNYFSIGIDSEVAYDFHVKRESSPKLFPHQTINKAWYGIYGIKNGFRGLSKRPLYKKVKLEIDGEVVPLPKSIKSLLCLQIPSYSSGVNPWGDPSDTKNQKSPPSICDGMFEVLGTNGILHLGRLRANIGRGVRIGQAKSCVITTLKPIAAQIDGEPVIIPPSKFYINKTVDGNMIYNLKENKEHKFIKLTGKEPVRFDVPLKKKKKKKVSN